MTGPLPPSRDPGPAGPRHAGPHPVHRGGPPAGYPAAPIPVYPGPPQLPLPMPYRPPRSRRLLIAGLVLAAVALAAILGYAAPRTGTDAAGENSSIDPESAKTAIQAYLAALLDRDIDTVARNTLCGIYDGVSDHRSDNAVAKMGSDAFRKQFSQAEVTSIDKIVYLSDFQAQALFTMRVAPVSGGQRSDHTQGLAQLLAVDGGVLVCSYQLRSAGAF